MKNTTMSTSAFEPRQRSIAPTSVTSQGRSVPVAGYEAGWQTPLLPTSAFGGAARGNKRHTAPTTDPRSRIPVLT